LTAETTAGPGPPELPCPAAGPALSFLPQPPNPKTAQAAAMTHGEVVLTRKDILS
jgi:hypothetical protein